jgi:tRNA threonylcarbamoyladenosine biosynthesis protein TsaB
VRILGLDTATRRVSVGLLIDGAVAVEYTQAAEGSHAVSLVPLIEAVLRQAECPVDSLDGIAVSNGPGSFTGLRVGLSVAKGLACATGARLVAVPTLEALARTAADLGGAIGALLDARKGELYAACFESSARGWARLTPDALVTPEALLAMLPFPCVVLGDAVIAYGSWLADRLGARVTVLPFEAYGPRGGVVATMGAERFAAGLTADLAGLEPFYIRPSEAELKAV